jgi:hemerythrin-like domain-containing protein
MKTITRRSFLFGVGGMAGVASLAQAGTVFSQLQVSGTEADVSPAEDLMREHGLLRRVLLIYREWIGRLRHRKVGEIDTLAESCRIIRSFVEDYHEKLEEEHLFPRFREAGKLVDLAQTLLEQHQAGRRLTDTALRLSNGKSIKAPAGRRELSLSLGYFIRMYEPHSAREDTVLFPAFHEMMPEKQYDELGDVFEGKENELFGAGGFEKMVDKVASIEKKLGIYDLSRFTPGP